MNQNSSDVRFKLEAPPEKLDQMTAELEDAPTYRMKLPPPGRRDRVIYLGNLHNNADDGSINTKTTLATRSLYRKLANYSNTPEEPADSRYERLDVLGEGGTGVVYEMTDHNVGRQVAVKVLKQSQSDEERQAFISEGKVSAKLEHPNIIPIYDMDIDDSGQVFITMKKVKGVSLKSYIDGGLNMSFEDIILVFLKVCDAVEYAHSHDMTHQDIKPENVMIGDYGEVFLIDWGAAILQSDEMQLSPVYMSPQQAAGEMPSLSDDIYCLGASLFHVLTKRFPTNASTIKELWGRKVDGEIDLPTAKEKRTIPRPLLAIAVKAMNKDPEQRYTSVETFADDLKAYQSGFPTDAENAGLVTVLELLIKRRFREATILLAAVALLILTGGGYYLHSQKTRSALAEAKLEAYKLAEVAEELEEERTDHWNPVLSQEFVGNNPIDPGLTVASEDVSDEGLYLMYQSPVTRFKTKDRLEGELKVELTFTSPTVPSFNIGFMEEDHENTRFFIVGGTAMMVSYFDGYRKLCSSPAKIRDLIRTDQANTLQCWRQNSTWHLTLNGTKLIEYFDPDLKTGIYKTYLTISRHTIFGELKLTSLKVWNRQPADFIPVLERGRLFRQMGEYEKARDWFLTHGKNRTNNALEYEAAYYAASIDAGQGLDQQIAELNAIANDRNNPYRHAAMHRVACLTAENGRHEEAIRYLIRAAGEAPELNTYFGVWPQLEDYVLSLPDEQKNRVLTQLAGLPLASIQFNSKEISDITFIKHCRAPKVWFINSTITDISPLRGLNINDLQIGSPGITDLSPLKGMPLRELNISKTAVTDLSPLEGMQLDMLVAKSMKSLDYSTVKNLKVSKLIMDFSSLKNPSAISDTGASLIRAGGCKLENLDFVEAMQPVELIAWFNDISDISGLANKKIARLELQLNRITNITPLASATVTNYLDLSSNPLSDISPLMRQPIRELKLNQTEVRDLTVLRTMPHLKILSVESAPKQSKMSEKYKFVSPDIRTLGNLNLETLSLARAGITDLTPLKDCNISEKLDLTSNPITDLNPLTGLKVKKLNLHNTPVTDLKPLTSMKHLTALDLSRSPDSGIEGVPDLTQLAGMNLTSLSLSGIPVTDLSPLRDCKKLKHIFLNNCPVSDISPLIGQSLNDFDLSGTDLTDLSMFRGRKVPVGRLVVNATSGKRGKLSDLQPLLGTSIVFLNLHYQNISDISPLIGCTLTGSLELRGNPVKDIKALEGKDITSLNVSETQVTDITVIRTMRKLRKINVKGLSLNEESEKLLKSRPRLQIIR